MAGKTVIKRHHSIKAISHTPALKTHSERYTPSVPELRTEPHFPEKTICGMMLPLFYTGFSDQYIYNKKPPSILP